MSTKVEEEGMDNQKGEEGEPVKGGGVAVRRILYVRG